MPGEVLERAAHTESPQGALAVFRPRRVQPRGGARAGAGPVAAARPDRRPGQPRADPEDRGGRRLRRGGRRAGDGRPAQPQVRPRQRGERLPAAGRARRLSRAAAAALAAAGVPPLRDLAPRRGRVHGRGSLRPRRPAPRPGGRGARAGAPRALRGAAHPDRAGRVAQRGDGGRRPALRGAPADVTSARNSLDRRAGRRTRGWLHFRAVCAIM